MRQKNPLPKAAKITRRSVSKFLLASAIGSVSGPFSLHAQSNKPIKLGASLSMSGKFSDSATFQREGYEIYVSEVNASGGIGGRMLELIAYDDASSPDTGRLLAERLISRDEVTAILGPYSSPITDAVATACERGETPMIGPTASDSGIWNRRPLTWSFQGFPSSTYDHESFLAESADKGIKKLAIVFEETPFSIAAKEWAIRNLSQAGIAVDTYGSPVGNQDFRSIIERIAASGADVISGGLYLSGAVAMVRQMIERGIQPTALHLITAAEGAAKEALGPNIEGIFGRSSWEPTIHSAANEKFIGLYKKKYDRVPSYHAASAYATAQAFGAALAKSQDRTGIRSFLASQKVETVAGTFAVDEKGRQTGYHYLGVQWQSGERMITWPDNVKTADMKWPKPKWV
jgi:branched-chain amino acid transport system substrate-binding protein